MTRALAFSIVQFVNKHFCVESLQKFFSFIFALIMAPNQSKTAHDGDDGKVPRKTPPLSLVPVSRLTEETCTYKLLANPTAGLVANAAKYSFTMPVLDGTDDVRAAIQFFRDINKVFAGLAMPGGAGAESVARSDLAERMLRGTALAAYQKGLRESLAANLILARERVRTTTTKRAAETDAAFTTRLTTALGGVTYECHVEDVNKALCAVIIAMAPHKALQHQKRWMRRNLRKTRDLNVRAFATHLARINDEEIPCLPPNFNATQKIAEDEMIEILTQACPRAWSAEMDRQNFDAQAEGWHNTVEFLARQETAAEHEGAAETRVVSNKPNKKPKSSNDKGSSKGSGSGTKFCHYHGKNSTHDSNNCRTLKKMAESAQKGGSSGGSRNKTWKRQADAGKDKTKDLASFIKKTIRAELNSFGKKKRKNSDVEEGEMDQFGLSGFNYSDMDNLKIDTDDEVSV